MSWAEDEGLIGWSWVVDEMYANWAKRMKLIDQSIWLDATGTEHPFAQMEDSYIQNCINWSIKEAELAQDEYDYYSDWDGDVTFRNEEIDCYIDDLKYIRKIFTDYYNERINSKMISWE